MQDDSYTVLVSRIQALEEITTKQVQLIETIVSEKQSLQIRVKSLEALCSPSDVIFPGGENAIENEAGGPSPEDASSQTQKHVVLVRSDDTNPLEPVLTQLTQRVNEFSADLQAMKNEVRTKLASLTGEGNTNIQSLKSEFHADLQDLRNTVASSSTSLYVRWGSSKCPATAVVVYSGIIGGSRYDETGGAANYLCLPLSNLALAARRRNKNAYLFGGEYETQDQHHDKDALCTVCQSTHPTSVMISTRSDCPLG